MKTLRALLVATFTLTFTLTSFPDTTVAPQTVGSGQTLQVTNPGKVTTTESPPANPTQVQVQVQTGGKAVLIGGTSVVLKPGFRADSGSLFRASRDLNLAGLPDLTDADFDGLPDAWEILHWGNLTDATGLMDSDGDGISNAAEYYAGTNPRFNESTATLGAFQVVLKMPNGKYRGVTTGWDLASAP